MGNDIISFDIEPLTFLVQIISTLVLFFVVAKFAVKPMRKFLAARREYLETEMEKAKAVNEAAELLKAEANAELIKIKNESGQMLEVAGVKAQAKYDAIVSDAKVAASAQIEKAQALIERKHQEMLYDARKEIEQQTATIASKIVQKEIDASQHDDLFDDFVKLIGGGADE